MNRIECNKLHFFILFASCILISITSAHAQIELSSHDIIWIPDVDADHPNWIVYSSTINRGLAPIDSEILNYEGNRLTFDYKIENDNGFLDVNIMRNIKDVQFPLATGSEWRHSPPININSDDKPVLRIHSRDNSREFKIWIAFSPAQIAQPEVTPPEVTQPNGVPNKPDLIKMPSKIYNNSSCEFSVISTDPDCDNIKYSFNWGDGEITETDWHNSGDTVNESHRWAHSGTYNLAITATDFHGANNTSYLGKPLTVSWLIRVPSGTDRADLQKLIDIAEQDTVLMLEGGVCNGPINISKSNITLTSMNSNCVIRCAIDDDSNYSLSLKNAENVTIERLNICEGLYGIYLENCTNCNITNNIISFKKCGLCIVGGSKYRIVGNDVIKEYWINGSEDSVGIAVEDADNINLVLNNITDMNDLKMLYYLDNSEIDELILSCSSSGVISYNNCYHLIESGTIMNCNCSFISSSDYCSLSNVLSGCK